MRLVIFSQRLIIFFCATKILCLATNGSPESETLTFFKRGVGLPGPSMSFSKSIQSGIFEFEFKTFVDRALLLYQDDNGDSDYIRLSIEKGRLKLSSYSLKGYDDLDLSTSNEMLYNDFMWHTVRMERNLTHFKLVLDGKTESIRATSSLPSFKSHLQLGGFPKSRYDNKNEITNRDALILYIRPFRWRGFFIGCIRNIRYGQDAASLVPVNESIPSLTSHVTKGRCDLSLCDKRRKNKPPGICENQGVCIRSAGKKPPTCDCRWTGYNGSTCTEDALRLTLNGSYKVAYKWRTPVPLKQEKFTLRIKTSRKNATILVAKGAEGSSDKLLLEIKESKFLVTSNIGDDQGYDILRSSEAVSDNEWHLVRYQRNGSILSLTVDGKTSKLISNNSDSDMNYKNILYIGEDNSPYNLTIEMEDFIWEYQDKEINFVKGLFESFTSSKDSYMILPSGVLPKFNWKLPERLTKDKEMNISFTTASTDIDDCNNVCHPNANCSKRNGTHVCICKPGYTGDGLYNCTDIDECERSVVPCHEHAHCSNTNGSYKCTCETGFYGEGHLNCTDVDECTQQPVPCAGDCENVLGSYSCRCSRGFTGDGKQNCTDIDECAESANVCGKREKCRNTEGSFYCIEVCDPGYTWNEHVNCTDIDECAKDGSVCNRQATCINTEGSFMCKCPDKYHGDGVSTCLRNDPCGDLVPCFPGLKCVETTDGSYSCGKCPPSFVGDGVRCERNKSKNGVSIESELILTNEKWSSKLTDISTLVYKALATKLIGEMRKIYEKHPEFVYALITKFRKGSVVVEFELIFTKDIEDPLKLLREAVNNHNFGNMTVEMRKPVENTAGSEKKDILGLNQTIFICVVALAAGVCILCVALIIFTLIIRQSRQRNAQIHKGNQEESINLTEPQGLLYKTSTGEANGQCVS